MASRTIQFNISVELPCALETKKASILINQLPGVDCAYLACGQLVGLWAGCQSLGGRWEGLLLVA